ESDPGDEEVMQYADYAEWLGELRGADDEEARRARAFWRGLDLGSIPGLALPLEQPAQAPGPFEPEWVEHRIPAEAIARFARLAGSQGTSVRVVSFACWAILLGRLTGRSEILVDVVADGRTHDELGDALGLYARALPIPCRFDPEALWARATAELEDT